MVSSHGSLPLPTGGSIQNALADLPNAPPVAFLNEHFFAPQSVSSIFTGRTGDLEVLGNCLQDVASAKQSRPQKRFVIYGLPGSGKTQFCCKFASDYKQSFWGVFWIDASSQEHARQSFSTIARVGKVEPNERAAKSWLSSLSRERPWLLIIDNADEANFPVEDCYPGGESGVILITTRNPLLKVHGTIGPRYFEFAELQEDESVELLLKAADEPSPWSASTLASAQAICKTLGYLPLALLHAGTTILGRLCTISTYLSYFEKNWNRIRRLKISGEAIPTLEANTTIYSTYELIHEGLLSKGTQASEDALDLLKIFSFFHLQRIRVDVFIRAALNPGLEESEQQRRAVEEAAISRPFKTNVKLRELMKDYRYRLITYILRLGDRPPIPPLLRDLSASQPFDEIRLRNALKELFQMSLIFANPDPKDDSYSMHPAVHLWVRERPEMTTADQAIWCRVSATILTRAILLPPLGDKEEDEILRRDLLPHVDHVQHYEHKIRRKFLVNQETRRRIWPVLQPRLDRNRAIQLVKFSLVYTQCDHLEEAKELQSEVARFAEKTLGIEHTATMDILLLLSSTYWQLTRGEEAAELQRRVLDACTKVRGQGDLKTLKIMDAYGSSLWQQGRILEARKVHEAAFKGLRKLLGESNVDTLKAMGNLGRAIGKDFHFTKAIMMQSKALSGLRQQFGFTHLDTLIALDNLAMAYYDRAAFGFGHPQDLERAVRLEEEVFEKRKEKLGREHLFTLWAGLNLARIKALQGETDEAIAIFLEGHVIALRNLGETHFAVLFAKLHYGRILMQAKRYEEAETLLMEVIESHESSRKSHPDRLLALFSLIKCRNLLGKIDGVPALMEELTEHTKTLFGEDHAFVKYLLNPENLSQEPDYNLTPKSRTASWDITPSRTASWNTTTPAVPVSGKLMPAAMIAKYGHI